MKHTKALLAISFLSLLAGCGGDSTTRYGTFDLGVADNPAKAEVVNIAFRQVVLKNSSGSYSFNVAKPTELKHVDLLKFQYPYVETLVSGESVPVGEYQMCIYMKNSEVADPDSSYVQAKVEGNIFTFGLVTNSNGSCGGVGADEEDTGRIFINKSFTISEGSNHFVADFQLSQGLQSPHGNKEYWTLKPTAVQLSKMTETGAISGKIDQPISIACGEDQGHAVYLYPEGTELGAMLDFRIRNEDGSPIASARANPIDGDVNNKREYGFGSVVAGTYSLGYTCVAENDDPDAENTPTDTVDPFFIYLDEQDISVIVGETTTVIFQ